MTALFYQIINNIEKITHKNYKDFKTVKDIDNIKVLRNKLERLLGEYKITDKKHKPIRGHLRDLKKFLHEIDDIIHEMEE